MTRFEIWVKGRRNESEYVLGRSIMEAKEKFASQRGVSLDSLDWREDFNQLPVTIYQ
jgi:hypothetical protein